MASTHKSLRSGTANKRPTTSIADGQIALNTNSASPGLFFKDSTGATIIKVGPVHVGTTAPNVSPATGGSAGNSTGEVWLDTSLTPYGVKIWDGSAWQNATPSGSTTVQGLLELATNAETQTGSDTARAVTPAGLQSKVSDSTSTTSSTTIASSTAVKAAYDLAAAAVPLSGGTVTGNLEIGATGSLSFEGATANAFETTIAVVDPTADRTITLPDTTGTVVTTGDTGTVTSTMILDGTIVDADVSASAEIAVSKLADGAARQLLQTDAAGTGVEWTSNVDVPGTLDVTGAAVFDSTTSATGTSTAASFIPTSSTAPTNGVYLPAANSVAISTNGSGRLFVDSGGGVGINIANPATRLDVNGNTRISGGGIRALGYYSDGTSAYNVALGTTGNVGYLQAVNVGNLSQLSIDGSPIVFRVGSYSEAMRLDSSGRLGVGTSSPSELLHVVTTTSTNSTIKAEASGTGQSQIQLLAGTGATNRASRIDFFNGVSSTSTPRWTLINDYNQGGTNDFRFASAANASALTITQAGLVGLGTSVPGSRLVSRDTNESGIVTALAVENYITGNPFSGNGAAIDFNLNNNGNVTGVMGRIAVVNTNYRAESEMRFYTGISSAVQQRMVLDSSGRLGIGVTPVEKLHVAGNIYAAGGDVYIDGTNMLSTPNVQPLRFGISLSEKARLTSDGKFLVGTSSARSNFSGTDTPQFQVEGNSFNTSTISVVAAQSAGGGNIELGSTGGTTVGSTGTVSTNGYLGSIHFLGGNGTNLLKAAAIECQVDGTVSGGGAADMPGRLVFSTTSDNASSPTERFKIDRNGSLRSSNVTGTNLVCVNDGASGTAVIYFQTSSVELGKISTNGSNAVTYATSSDYRLKENIIPLENAVARLRQLKPSRFNFLNTPGQTVDGFIAHEAQAVVPECATGVKDEVDADGNPVYQGIDQSKLVPLLTAALQEALAEIESLKARVTALEP